jgi:hypothetical protein
MLGEARSKFGSIAGPGGAIQMNGAALKTEADKEFEKLDKELMDYTAGGSGYYFVTG